MKCNPRPLLILALLLAAVVALAHFQPAQAAGEPPEEPVVELPPELEQVFLDRLNQAGLQSLGFLIYEPRVASVEISPDGSTALIWLAFHDPETGERIEGEPGLVIARLTAPQDGQKGIQSWDVTMQTDQGWQQALDQVPGDMLGEELRDMYYQPEVDEKSILTTVYRGYKLPWPAGVSRRVSQSVSHTTCGSWIDCRYAWDFAENSPNQNFPILASRGGTVFRVRWDVPTRPSNACGSDGTTGNFIVLEDRTTTPFTYQLYLHLAADSIPERLRVRGAAVSQGEYIGLVDNTGASCGSHLHFHVHANPNSYWGTSVDIRFDDVSINDGRPRTCAEAANWPAYGNQCAPNNRYVSGNVGTNPPSGSLSLPAPGEEINTPTVLVAGTAQDDQQVTLIQIIARGLDGVWKDVGGAFNQSPFAVDANLCAAGIPNGPVEIALRVWDNHGNVTIQPQGIRTVLKNHTCSVQPACTLTDNKIILYSQPNYTGVCREYLWNGEITVPDLASGGTPVGSNNAQSIRVGSGVRAVLYDGTSYSGRAEAFEQDDFNLADNPIGARTASSLRVQARSAGGLDSNIVSPASGAAIPATQSITLFMTSPFASRFTFTLNRGGQTIQIIEDLAFPAASLGTLPPGSYSVRGCAKTGASGANCADQTSWVNFTVTSASLPNNNLKTVPFNDSLNVNNGEWHATGGWQHTGQHWRYGNGTSFSGEGSLTSPPIRVPDSGSPYLYFNYRHRTESSAPWWDQRRLQISVDGGAFTDLPEWGQFYNDPLTSQTWLNSPNIDLSAYLGRTVRVRFYFNALDTFYNQGSGWEIENVQVLTTQPTSGCAAPANNTSLASARWMNIGDTLVGETLCIPGTQLHYQFFGFQGQTIRAEVNAAAIGSHLDPYLFLLDTSGGLIAENDDIVAFQERDSRLDVTLPYTGVYYLRVKAWDHPGAGGPEHYYVLRLFELNTPPNLRLTIPAANWIAGVLFELRAEVNASASGIEQVDFYYHSSDWLGSRWQLIGSDSDGSDGWSMNVDPAAFGGMVGGAVYAEARSAGGLIWGDLRLNLQIDGIRPTSQMTGSLPASPQSTAILLNWTAADDVSGVDRVEFQYRVNDGAWQDWNVKPRSASGSVWFLGEGGRKYEFRIRAVDRAGNVQDWNPNGQSTTLPTACLAGSNEPVNNQRSGAVSLAMGSALEQVLCPAADQDWLRVEALAGVPYMTMVNSLAGGAAVRLGLYDHNGALLMERSSVEFGQGVNMPWSVPASGTYFLRVTPLADGLYGSDVRYRIWCGEPKLTYLPLIHR